MIERSALCLKMDFSGRPEGWRLERKHILDKTKLAILSHKQRLAELIITTEYFVPVLKACLDCKGKALGKDVGSSTTSALNGR